MFRNVIVMFRNVWYSLDEIDKTKNLIAKIYDRHIFRMVATVSTTKFDTYADNIGFSSISRMDSKGHKWFKMDENQVSYKTRPDNEAAGLKKPVFSRLCGAEIGS